MVTATATSNNHPRPFADHIYQPVASPEHTSEAPSTMNQGHMTKVQALTPLSVLVTLAALTVCAVAINPGLGQVSQEHGTYLTPNASLVLFFWAVMFLLQVGFALLVVLSQKEFTKVRYALRLLECSPIVQTTNRAKDPSRERGNGSVRRESKGVVGDHQTH